MSESRSDLYKKSAGILELHSVLNMLAAEAVCEPAKEKALLLFPGGEISEAAERQKETTAAKMMLDIKGSPAFTGIKDIRPALGRAGLGGVLSIRELLDTAAVLNAARTAKSYAEGDKSAGNTLDFLFASLTTNKFLEEKIIKSLPGEDEVADSASAELSDIRRYMRAANVKARDALQKIITSPAYTKALQEPIITTRSERYVVPVKAEYKNIVPGLVHDVSASGATLFIEPMAAVKANNELRELLVREKREIERILMELSSDCAEKADDLTRDFNLLVALDVVFAKAKLSAKLRCIEPELSGSVLKLIKARHPLLDPAAAVPTDTELGGEYDTLVITGPNTGGKTVVLKTMGLLCLMALCGLHIPAETGSSIPVYKGVFADIGDEQSIEQSLSTFSSHMTNIVRILKENSGNCLLLFDELGAGTDPAEGAALAVAVIEQARSAGAYIAATTHYGELKIYASTAQGVQNASCEFDAETLKPTYRLLMGIPGKSNAFAISERLGLPKKIIEDAASRLSAETVGFEDLMEKLEHQRRKMDEDALETEKKLIEAKENANAAEQFRAEMAEKLKKTREEACREAAEILNDARTEAEYVFKELDNMRKHHAEEEDHNRVNEARAGLLRRLNSAEDRHSLLSEVKAPGKKSARPLKAGDTAEIVSMGIKATVLSVSGDGTVDLRAGIINLSLKEDELFLIEDRSEAAADKNTPRNNARFLNDAYPAEIDMRGMTSDEAIPLMERFIDNAVLGKLNTITVIHGKGTGALRKAVQKALKTNSQVKNFRAGRYGEGETGVTVVELN
ncbi:MAG: endonuclease MutS2 [Oscillospiraceae bacterium]|nr:endonuclease MutS2 [Oscillospiraceae bacterium]